INLRTRNLRLQHNFSSAHFLPTLSKFKTMPAVYYIGTYDIDDMEEFKNYPPKVAQLLTKYQEQVLASGVEAVALEGKARTMNAIIKFPSMDAAMGMYNDAEYQEQIRPIRLRSTSNC